MKGYWPNTDIMDFRFLLFYSVLQTFSMLISVTSDCFAAHSVFSIEESFSFCNAYLPPSVMQSLSNELSTPVSDSVKCKQTKVDMKMRYIPKLT